MDMRRRIGMRRLIDETLRQLEAGNVSPDAAARALHGAGVPLRVIGRMIGGAGRSGHRWTAEPAGRETWPRAA